MNKRAICGVATALTFLLTSHTASADGPPYSGGGEWVCFRSGQPIGTLSDFSNYATSASPATGALSASGAVGDSIMKPTPRVVCAGASVNVSDDSLASGRYIVTARVAVATEGPSAPSAYASSTADPRLAMEQSAEATVDLAALAMSCHEDGRCSGGGSGEWRPLACAPSGVDGIGVRCANPGEVIMSTDVRLDPGEFLLVDVGAFIHANSGYLGRAGASLSATVEDISVEPAADALVASSSSRLDCTMSITARGRSRTCAGGPGTTAVSR